jgi:hypothetical protein
LLVVADRPAVFLAVVVVLEVTGLVLELVELIHQPNHL